MSWMSWTRRPTCPWKSCWPGEHVCVCLSVRVSVRVCAVRFFFACMRVLVAVQAPLCALLCIRCAKAEQACLGVLCSLRVRQSFAHVAPRTFFLLPLAVHLTCVQVWLCEAGGGR